MRKSKIRTLLIASVMIMLCAATIVGGTYAMWSSNIKVTTHLVAGSLDVQLKRTYLEKYSLKNKMYMATEVSSDTVDFTTPTSASVFGIDDDELVVPTTHYAARLELSYNGDFAIDYTINIVVSNESDKNLAKQLKVYIGKDGNNGSVVYDNGRYLANDVVENGEGTTSFLTYNVENGVLVGSTKKTHFWIKIELPRDASNLAQSQEVYFDLCVTATQKPESEVGN